MKYEGEINEKNIYMKPINNWYEKKERWILRKKERKKEKKERKKERKKEIKYEGEINEKKYFYENKYEKQNWYEKKENWILRKKERKKERNEVWRRNRWKKYLYENKLITDMKRKKGGY